MRLLSLNLRHGGGTRIPAIAEFLGQSDADILVLTEFRAGRPGEKMEAALETLGYRNRWRSVDMPKTNGVLMVSRLGGTPLELAVDGENGRRILGCRVAGIDIYGVYFALGPGKLGLFDFIAGRSAFWVRQPALILGDFNTGRHKLDEAGATFHLTDRFEALVRVHGWTDAWRHLHGDEAQEFTWYSPRGNGFRLDHVFASPPVMERIRQVRYDHSTRPDLTDHSAMIVDVDGVG